VDALRAALAEALGDWTESVSGNATPVNERQRGAIQTAVDSLGRAASLADGARETIDCADLLAFELREALDALGAVTGEVATDDLLRRVFAEFCIGK